MYSFDVDFEVLNQVLNGLFAWLSLALTTFSVI